MISGDLLCQWTDWLLMKPTSFNYILLVSDYVVVGSDSGRIVILEYIPSKNTFEKVTNLKQDNSILIQKCISW